LLDAREVASPAAARADEVSCLLADGAGHPLARRQWPPPAGRLEAAADLAAEGWTAPSPWRLRCVPSQEAASSLVEPLAARSRTTLALNLAAMALAVVLGLLAVREVAQRERVEARAHEEVRVRDLERQ